VEPTVAAARTGHLLALLADARRGALLVGAPGSGKTTLAHAAAARAAAAHRPPPTAPPLPPRRSSTQRFLFVAGAVKVEPCAPPPDAAAHALGAAGPEPALRRACIVRSCQLLGGAPPGALAAALEQALQRDPDAPGRLRAPPGAGGAARTLLLVVDDVHLAVEEPLEPFSDMGASFAGGAHAGCPVEALRALASARGLHAGAGVNGSKGGAEWLRAPDAVLLLTAAPARAGGAGGRWLPGGLTRCLARLAVDAPEGDDLRGLIAPVLARALAPLPPPVRRLRAALAEASLEAFGALGKEFPADAPARLLCAWSLHDLLRLARSFALASPHTCPEPPALARLWIHEAHPPLPPSY
jgi:hypothetical protein